MKMLMIVIDESKKEELEVFLEHRGVLGYTEIPRTTGLGTSGHRLGSRAFPRTSAVIFTMLDDDALAAVRDGIDAFCADCGERLRMIAWEAEELT